MLSSTGPARGAAWSRRADVRVQDLRSSCSSATQQLCDPVEFLTLPKPHSPLP